MEIRTGYFSQLKKYEAMGYTPVSISRIKPKWYTGATAVELSPSADLLYNYKHGLVDVEQYATRYFGEIDKRVIDVYLKQWEILVKNTRGIVLLCYEKPNDFCHRHLLAEFINKEYGFNVTEIDVKKET